IRSHGQPAYGIGWSVEAPDQVQHQAAHEHLSLGVHRRSPTIHVVVAPATGGQHEITELQGSLPKQVEKPLTVVHQSCRSAVWWGETVKGAIVRLDPFFGGPRAEGVERFHGR